MPAELYDALEQKAERDAEVAANFLIWLGRNWQGEAFDLVSYNFPMGFWWELSAALQLLAWEQRGIFIHREAGLPSAHDALREIFDSFASFGDHPSGSKLTMEVVRLFVQRFAWHGYADLHAEILLDELGEDAALEALAEFLWANRRIGIANDDPAM